MALYIPHSIFHLARLLYVRPETFGPYYVQQDYIHKAPVIPHDNLQRQSHKTYGHLNSVM